ncbi:Bifunctional methyltransferase, partial [Pseudolycoriella hygida]
YILPQRLSGFRLDKALVHLINKTSRSQIQKIINDLQVKVNDLIISYSDFKVKENDVITVELKKTAALTMQEADIKLDIFYEDEDLIVINKAAGMAVHPGNGNHQDTLVNALLHYTRSLSSIGGWERPGIVHRLDKDTTGLMVIAKNNFAHVHLADQIQSRKLIRKYKALIWGVINPLHGIIKNNIGRSRTDRQKMTILKFGGKEAITHYSTEEIFFNGLVSMVECKLATGRTHQIRVQLSHLRHSIVGDQIYGNNSRKINYSPPIIQKKLVDFKRQALHSWYITSKWKIIGISCFSSRGYVKNNLMSLNTIKELLISAAKKLRLAGISLENLEARILLQYASGKGSEYLLSRGEEEIPLEQRIIFEELVKRRLSLEPIAHIIGSKEFYGYEFIVNNQVLIPRSDTEILIEAILNNLKASSNEHSKPSFKSRNIATQNITMLELGTGSGCIAITVSLELPNIRVVATDISKEAIMTARQNAAKHNVLKRLQIIYSDWFNNLKNQKYDIIVSNPPYVSQQSTTYISLETLKYEPAIALFAEDDGLAAYYIIAKSAKNFLKKSGKLFLEVGFNQSVAVIEIFSKYNYTFKQIYRDLAGYDRVVLFSIE